MSLTTLGPLSNDLSLFHFGNVTTAGFSIIQWLKRISFLQMLLPMVIISNVLCTDIMKGWDEAGERTRSRWLRRNSVRIRGHGLRLGCGQEVRSLFPGCCTDNAGPGGLTQGSTKCSYQRSRRLPECQESQKSLCDIKIPRKSSGLMLIHEISSSVRDPTSISEIILK